MRTAGDQADGNGGGRATGDLWPGADEAGAAFGGTKAILSVGGRLVLLRRDDDPAIPHPGLVDLPGGGREGDETPVACTLREVSEEVGLALPPSRLSWGRPYSSSDGRGRSWLFAAGIDEDEAAALTLGDEGQALWLEPVETYLERDDAVPGHQARVRDWWDGGSGRGEG